MPFGSRFFLAPINTGFAVDGVPTEELFRFHEERSGRGVGVGYVGNVAISQDVRSNEGTAVISRAHRDVWEGVCRTSQARGSSRTYLGASLNRVTKQKAAGRRSGLLPFTGETRAASPWSLPARNRSSKNVP